MRKLITFLTVVLLIAPYAEAQHVRSRTRTTQRAGGIGPFGGARNTTVVRQHSRGGGGGAALSNTFNSFSNGFGASHQFSSFNSFGNGYGAQRQFNTFNSFSNGYGYGGPVVANQIVAVRSSRLALDRLNSYSGSYVAPAALNVIVDAPAHYYTPSYQRTVQVPVVERVVERVVEQAPVERVVERVVEQAPVVQRQTTTTTTTTQQADVPPPTYYRALPTPQAGPACEHPGY